MRQFALLSILILAFFAFCGTQDNDRSGFFPIKEFGKWGYMDDKGNTVIKCQFEWAGDFSEGLAPIRQDSLFGFVDVSGKMVIEPRFIKVDKFSDGLCMVSFFNGTNRSECFIDKTGMIAFEYTYGKVNRFYSGRAKVVIDDKICYIDKAGKIVIKTKYPYGLESDFKRWNCCG